VDEPVLGIADRVADFGNDEDDEAIAVRLRASLAADGIPFPEERGLVDLVRGVVARLRGQRLVEDLGEIDGSFELFGLHVPPAGRAALQLRRTATRDQHVAVNAMGLGFGRGRKLAMSIGEDIPERGECVSVRQHVVLRVRRFAAPGESARPLVMTDVVAWGRREISALPNCGYCGAPVNELSSLAYDQDTANALDLRAFDAALPRQTEITLEGLMKADIGVDLPLPGGSKLGAGFQLEQHTSMSCTTSYTFPPGYWYIPYRRRGQSASLPYWATG
jgi:hypothetical protein